MTTADLFKAANNLLQRIKDAHGEARKDLEARLADIFTLIETNNGAHA